MQMQKKDIIGLIKSLLLNSIRILEDEDYQRRLWFRVDPNSLEVGSYSDIIVHLLKRCESIFKEPTSKDYLGEENYTLLKKLNDLASDHLDFTESRLGDSDLLQEDELLNDPNWHDIQTLAGEVHIKLAEFVKRNSND